MPLDNRNNVYFYLYLYLYQIPRSDINFNIDINRRALSRRCTTLG